MVREAVGDANRRRTVTRTLVWPLRPTRTLSSASSVGNGVLVSASHSRVNCVRPITLGPKSGMPRLLAGPCMSDGHTLVHECDKPARGSHHGGNAAQLQVPHNLRIR
jgi:hypothetical protein